MRMLAIVLAITLACIAGAYAEVFPPKFCNGKSATLDLEINGCTAAIQSGEFAGLKLALLFNNRGSAYRRTGEFDGALQDFDFATILCSNISGPYYGRGLIYFTLGEFALAVTQFDAGLKIQPKFPVALYSRGVARLKIGYIAAGNADILAAKALQAEIGEEMAKRGVKP